MIPPVILQMLTGTLYIIMCTINSTMKIKNAENTQVSYLEYLILYIHFVPVRKGTSSFTLDISPKKSYYIYDKYGKAEKKGYNYGLLIL